MPEGCGHLRVGHLAVAHIEAGPQPGVADGIEALRTAGARHVAVAPWFVAPGRITDRVAEIARDAGVRMAAPLGAHALLAETPIIVVTIQTFPYAMEAIVTDKTLKGKNFAVIIDEAHNSQTGTTAAKLQTALAMSGQGKMASLTVEELLEQLQKSRARPDNISYFAFTGTPKHSTLMLFGRVPDPSQPPSKDNLPEAFHKYKMRQAIEEGFILDVLKGYVPYKTAFNLAKQIEDNKQIGRASCRERVSSPV